MKTMFTRNQVAAWRDGWRGFLKWLEDTQPRIPSASGGFSVFKPERFQLAFIRQALQRNADGTWKYGTIAVSMPRRHSKTVLCALLCLWRMTTQQGENIVVLANSERQASTIGFGLCRKIVLQTPALLQQVGRCNVQQFKIEVPALGNTMRTVSGNVSALYGEKISVGWVSEIHAALSDEGMQILASSLGDSLNSWLLIDSTVDGVGGPLHRLEQLQESGDDPTVYVHRIEYADLAEALEKSPPWIRRDWLKSRAAQLVPAQFASQHLNQRQGGDQNLFSPAAIESCKDRLPHPFTPEDLKAVAQGKTFITGGGLDRAYGFSIHGDSTIWTSVAKVASADPGEESHYYVLNQQKILGSLGTLIKKAIQADYDLYKLNNICIEAYNAQDISTWAIERGIPTEIIHATNSWQTPAFTALHRVVAEGRLHFSDTLDDLAREMGTFLYELKNGQPRFGSDKFRDDRVYSLCWAIHSLRQQELSSFTLDNIVCNSRSGHASACYLRGGDLILHCSNSCPSHIQVQQMFNQYRHGNVESEISLPGFFSNLVTVDGVHIFS